MRNFIFQKNRYQYGALLAIAAVACGGLAAGAAAVRQDAKANTPIPAVASLKETSNAFAAITKMAAPAVVFIKVEKKSVAAAHPMQPEMREFFQDDFMKKFFGDRGKQFQMPKFDMPKTPRNATGQGSGFIISEDGYILTNSHVVGGADAVNVTLHDGREFEAEIVGTDERSDVAVIKVDGSDLPVLRMGNSDDIEVGEWVLAVGSPFGLPGTVTSGIVSAKGRSSVGIADYENFIQTDAAINPGNSGGPLLNLKGEVIGINTAIYSRSGGYMGIGFAIPVNMARDICDQLMENGSVTRGYLGIAIQPLTAELAKSFGMDENAKGVLVGDVTKDSPAEKSGMNSGDVIVELEGKDVDDIGRFRNQVASVAPDTKVAMTVLRDGKRVSLDVTVGTLPGKSEVASAKPVGTHSLGLTVQPLDDALAGKFGYKGESGMIVTEVDSNSAAALAGIRPGTLIVEVNRKPVQNMQQFREALESESDDESVLLLVKHDGHKRFVVLKRG